jgi:PAS domain S-box-containing protein
VTTEHDDLAAITQKMLQLSEEMNALRTQALETQHQWEGTFDSIRDAVFLVDSDNRISKHNRAAEILLGKAASEIDGQLCFEVVHGTNTPIPHCPTQRMKESQQREHFMIELNDRWIAMTVDPIFNPDQSITGAVHVLTDVTERKQAQEALQESEARYHRITEGLVDYHYTVRIKDGHTVGTTQSPACEVVTGYTAEEFVVDPYLWIRMVAPEDRDLVRERVQQVLDGKEIPPIEHRIYRKDGEMRWVCDTTILQKDASGTLLSYDGVIKDITERKEAEAEKAELIDQNRQLQKAQSLGRMAGAIAHHFNNTLQAVTGNLELATEDLALGKNPAKFLWLAMQAALKAAEVSTQMLTYLGQTPSKRKIIDLAEVLQKSLPLLEAIMPKTIILKTELPSPGPIISANENQIQQVLANLLTNAREAFAEDGGIVHLSVKTILPAEIPEEHRFPLDWQARSQAYACLEITDTGCGISQSDIEKLFDPFFSSKFTGRGLGLPVVLGITRAHGGVITVESEPDKGSIFRVFLPVAGGDANSHKSGSDKSPSLLSKD